MLPFQKDWQAPGAAFQIPQAQAPQKKKSFLVDQISTLGGIVGGGLGTLISPIAGTGAGAALGSGLGEALENKITGQSLGKNVLKEAALGGVFGAGPIKLLKGAGAGGKALLSGADDVAGIASKAALTPLRKKAGEAVLSTADDLAVKQFRLTPTQLKNFKSKFGEDAGQTIRKYGFQNADEVAAKGIQPLQQQFDELVTGVGSVNKDTLAQAISKRVKTLSKAGPSDSKALGKSLKGEADNLLKGFGDTIDAKELNLIKNQFDALVNYTEKASNPARYGVNKRMADSLREALQVSDSTGSLKTVGKELQKLRQLSDVVERQSQLGRGSLPLGLSTMLGGVAGASAFGPAGLASAAGTAMVNSPMGRKAALTATEKLGGKLLASGEKASGQSLRGVIARVGGAGLASGAVNAPINQSLENSTMSANTIPNANAPMSSNMQSPYTENAQMSSGQGSTSPFAPENLQATIEQILASGGTLKDVNEVVSLAKSIQSLQPKDTAPKLNATQLQQANNAVSALNDIGSIRETLTSNPNVNKLNSLPGGNFTRNLTGTSNYEAARQNVADALGRLRSGGAINSDEEKRFLSMLPGTFDNPTVAEQKLARLESLFTQFANPVGATADTQGGDLASIIASYGQ